MSLAKDLAGFQACVFASIFEPQVTYRGLALGNAHSKVTQKSRKGFLVSTQVHALLERAPLPHAESMETTPLSHAPSPSLEILGR